MFLLIAIPMTLSICHDYSTLCFHVYILLCITLITSGYFGVLCGHTGALFVTALALFLSDTYLGRSVRMLRSDLPCSRP